MPNHLSLLGIIHTAISILAILVAFFALAREGKLSTTSGPGKLYILLTIITCLTGLPIMRTGHPTPGHTLAVMILVLIPIAIYAKSIPLLKKVADYVQIIIMSTTLFFSWVPACVETLTRLPISKPIADGPASPILQNALLVLVVFYLAGTTYQVLKLRARKKATETPDSPLTLG